VSALPAGTVQRSQREEQLQRADHCLRGGRRRKIEVQDVVDAERLELGVFKVIDLFCFKVRRRRSWVFGGGAVGCFVRLVGCCGTANYNTPRAPV
jgi:hypothetical protein